MICVVSCTRKAFKGTPLHRSVEEFTHLPFVETKVFEHNELGLTVRYNEALDSSEDILAFVHDDVEITDHWWFKRITEALEHWDLVGVAGNKKREPGQLSWAVGDTKGALVNQEYWAGAVARGNGVYRTGWDVFAPPWVDVELIDGCFMVTKAKTMRDHGIRFDEQFGFHHYDMDISRQFRAKGLRVGVMGLSIVHHSSGKIGPEWEQSCKKYLEKWSD